MQRKDSLNTLAEGYFSDSECRAGTAAVLTNYQAFENLNPLFLAFPYLNVYTNGVSRPHDRPLD
jgi:hypothetical protein